MDKPLRVSLVMPPRTTIENTHAHPPPSHQATDRTASSPPRTSACFDTDALATVDIAARLAVPTLATPPTKKSLALALALAAFLAFSASPRARAASRVHIPLLAVEVNSRIARTAFPFPFLTIHPRLTVGVIVTPLVVTPLKILLEPPPPPPLVSVRNIHRAAADADTDAVPRIVLRVSL
jgi:hypothetical protein